ncbi:beta-N-acetylhexosaminidase [Paenibacillus aceris]|uniref:beta-N-acetylhexosaminidase n=1 Tax=Paenibacillus aceris TaxID=869555 RepID=A0ABS4I7X1_9BACL|nr:beta-N-acetylhexosaminidase [Paenibacillus aceris]MBP1966960.1 beta-N-acetylhexosaminidase [Paenibacillus aceris]NHW39324.1 beta-N-acetylhexosaminidase [Paenibacillus aceris]
MTRIVYRFMKYSLGLGLCMSVLTGCFQRSTANPSIVPTSTQTGAPVSSSPASPSAVPTPTPTVDPVLSILQGMSVDEKIGQLIFAGIDGYEMNQHTRELIDSYHIGGMILYKTNVKDTGQLIKLVNALKQKNAGNKLPLWLGVDEEGGKVTRLPDEITKTPPSKDIGNTKSTEFAYGVGSLLGKELKAYGLNVDFAPVLDINSNPNNPVIGDRSFGANASIVSSLGIQTMKGLQAQKVMPVVKHFPGHGDTSVDSHVQLPVVQNDLARLRKLELLPFAEAFKQQADAVMVAHILLPKVDAQNPASMSKKIMTDLLRQEMGFQGLIMTDDMTMGAIIKAYDLGEAAVKSVLAGSNVVMVGHDYEKVAAVAQALRRAVEEKRIPIETIDRSVIQVMKLKQKYQLNDTVVKTPDTKQINADVKLLLQKYLNK